MAVEPHRGDGMILAQTGVAHHDDAQIVRRDPGLAQSNEFGDRIIFAIAGAAIERDEWRTPDVDFAILGKIAYRPDREIDGAVDLAEPGAANVLPGNVHDGEKLQGGGRCAMIAVAVAQRELHPFVVELALYAKPLFVQASESQRVGDKPKRLRRSAGHFQRSSRIQCGCA